MEVQQDAAISNVDLRLYENVAPLTVENFLKYVNGTTANGGNYINSFIHRSAAGFVVQGGGFTFDPTLNDTTFTFGTGGLQAIPTDPAVQNEPGRHNVRGTIAMAKLSGDPNSATSQWFINLADNSTSLDNDNGGFTVFGEVLSSGMTVVDEIAAQPVFDRRDIHSAFAQLPLINFTADPVVQANLVRTNSMTQLLSISDDVSFGPVLLSTTAQADVVIRNTGSASQTIGDISTTDVIDIPFSILDDACSNTVLAQDAQCIITIKFSPQSENSFVDTFNIELTDLGLSYTFTLRGDGVLTPAPDITPSLAIISFADAQIFDPSNGLPPQIVVTFNNDGNQDLNFTSMILGGLDAAEFEIFDNCVQFSPVVPGKSCVMPVNFKPLSIGNKSATVTIVSNDPDESPLVIPITGTASLDTDGIPAAIEDAAPNGGDGNNDGVPDSTQSNIVSLPGTGNTYITVVTRAGINISDVSMLSSEQLVTPPANVQFNLGALQFRIANLPVGSGVEVGLFLPVNQIPVTYYMYGPTPDDTNPHWYEFLFDGVTGAQLIGTATITAPDGKQIQRNLIRLAFFDGLRGDADLTANGTIIDPGAPVVVTAATSSGQMNIWFMLYLTATLMLLRSVGMKRQGYVSR